jgi:single-strand DNA-binding protein
MSELNHVILIGRVTKDAEAGYTVNKVPVYRFTIAHNRRRKENEKWAEYPHFFNFRLYGKKWEGIRAYLTGGTLVSIEGHLEQDRWEEEGKTRSSLKIAVDYIGLLGKVRGGEEPEMSCGEEESPLNDTGGFTGDHDEERYEREGGFEA